MTTRAISTFTFVSSWIGFALDKSLVSMRDLCTRMTLQGINLNLSTFSKASKIRESEPFEKIIEELTKRLIAKKGKADAQAMFPIDSKLFWFLCGNGIYTDSFFSKIVLKVFLGKYFTIL
ncbi:MAG: hypothetical protein ACKPJA_20390 [Microcystis panniformis]